MFEAIRSGSFSLKPVDKELMVGITFITVFVSRPLMCFISDKK